MFMPPEFVIIALALLAAYFARRDCGGWFAAISRLYIAGFYVLLLTGLTSPEVLRAVSRWGFVLIFTADIFPAIADYIKNRRGYAL